MYIFLNYQLTSDNLTVSNVIVLFAGIDNGKRLAATGILWHVHDHTWEVLFTGSMSWKDETAKGNLRSHKIVIKGPHFVFVRNRQLLGSKVVWRDVNRFPARDFFNYGTPGSEVDPTVLARESVLVKRFLQEKQPKGWSEVRVVSQVKKEKVVAVRESSSGRLPIKRSRRIQENQKKTLFRKRVHDRRALKIQQQEAEKAMKLANQQRRRDIRKMINEELVGYAYNKIRDRISKLVGPKLKNINSKITKLQREIESLPDVVQQVGEWRQEATERLDDTRNHYDVLLANIEAKLDQSVVDISNKMKRKCKKIAADVEKTSKEVSILGGRVNQIGKSKKAKRRRRGDKSGKKGKNHILKEVKAEAPPQAAVAVNRPKAAVAVHRPPTPMVPPRVDGTPWFHVNDPQIVGQQTYMTSGSTVPRRRVSPTPTPTPQFMSPVYAARNYIR